MLKKCAPEKAVPFTIVVVLCGIALGLLVGFALSGLGFNHELGRETLRADSRSLIAPERTQHVGRINESDGAAK